MHSPLLVFFIRSSLGYRRSVHSLGTLFTSDILSGRQSRATDLHQTPFAVSARYFSSTPEDGNGADDAAAASSGGDDNGDGSDGEEDILWHNEVKGLNAVWYFNDAQRIGSELVDSLII